MRYLRHRATGQIFAWTDLLAAQEYLEEVFDPLIPPRAPQASLAPPATPAASIVTPTSGPWTIHFLENPPLHPPSSESKFYDGSVDFGKLQVGEMCYYHHQGKPCTDRAQLDLIHLSAHYFANNAGRPPLILALPDKPSGKIYFPVDGQCYSNKCTKCGNSWRKCTCGEGNYSPKGYYDGWAVSGSPPLITVSPSINYDDDEHGVKHYHGFVQNGIISPG
jgi:hypothetical protein